MGIENLRIIKIRYVVEYDNGAIGIFIRTLEQIEKTVDFPLNNCKIIAKNLYIGTKDLDEDEIFENDIVVLIPTGKINRVIGEVRWKHGSYMIEPFVNDAQSTCHYYLKYGRIKKLGNIFEAKGKKIKREIIAQKKTVEQRKNESLYQR